MIIVLITTPDFCEIFNYKLDYTIPLGHNTLESN
jgi:hypothetical protein